MEGSTTSREAAALSALRFLAPCVILGGQAGVGKTTLAISLALDAAMIGESVTLIDLDVVNPYFRSSESRERLEAAGIALLAPQFAEAGSNLDAPALTAAIEPALESIVADSRQRRLIVDLGGESDGARTLARFAPVLEASDVWGLYGVVNAFRPFNDSARSLAAQLTSIAAASRLELSGLINNSHLMGDTTASDWTRGRTFAAEVARAAAVVLAMTTEPAGSGFSRDDDRCDSVKNSELIYPIRLYGMRPWDSDEAVE